MNELLPQKSQLSYEKVKKWKTAKNVDSASDKKTGILYRKFKEASPSTLGRYYSVLKIKFIYNYKNVPFLLTTNVGAKVFI